MSFSVKHMKLSYLNEIPQPRKIWRQFNINGSNVLRRKIVV